MSYSSVEFLFMRVTLRKIKTLKHSNLISATDRQGSLPTAVSQDDLCEIRKAEPQSPHLASTAAMPHGPQCFQGRGLGDALKSALLRAQGTGACSVCPLLPSPHPHCLLLDVRPGSDICGTEWMTLALEYLFFP